MMFPSNCRLCGCNGCNGRNGFGIHDLTLVFHQLFAVVVIVVAIVATGSRLMTKPICFHQIVAVEAPKVAVLSIRLMQLQWLPWFQNT